MTPALVVSFSALAPVIGDISLEPGVPPVPAIERVALAPEIGYVVSVQPVTFFVGQTMEQNIDRPGTSIARDTLDVVSSSPDAAHAASAPVVEYLAPVIECGSSSSSAAHAAPEQAPSKSRRRAQYAPLSGVLQDAVFLAPDAWPPVRHA